MSESPSTPTSPSVSTLSDLHSQIRALEAEYNAKGVPLTGRIIHVTHYLPVTAARAAPKGMNFTGKDANAQVLSPPLTPPVKASKIDGEPANPIDGSANTDKWTLGHRWGHTAMFSGIHSLARTHDQLVIGWLGDVASGPSSGTSANSTKDTSQLGQEAIDKNSSNDLRVKIPTSALSPADRAALEEVVAAHKPELATFTLDETAQGRENGSNTSTKDTRYVPVWLEDKVAHGHYDGYCKTTLWPLFHYLLWQDVASESPVAAASASKPTSDSDADPDFAAYVSANRAYARALALVYKPGDLVWVHDYHLLLVPKFFREEVRALEKEAKAKEAAAAGKGGDVKEGEEVEEGEGIAEAAVVGLFVHTPFPSSEIFRCLPRRKEILDGMLAANLVVFQTYSYARHFTSSCIRVCGYESAPTLSSQANGSSTNVAAQNPPPPSAGSTVSYETDHNGGEGKTMSLRKKAPGGDKKSKGAGFSGGIDNQGHITGVAHCPVGVDAGRVGWDVATLPGIEPKAAALRALYEGKKIIVARDKLDVVKGVVQKLRAFERFLQTYPEWVHNVVLIQVTSPALSDSPKLERQVSELVAHINGEFGTLDFVPVHHYHQTIKKDEFYALLSVADLGVITPLRDGMNTTSMEYVIAQAGKHGRKSPLVLSEFMGISSTMDDALLVNPWDLGGVASAIHHGLLMSSQEKSDRQAKLYKVVTTHTSHTWAASLVQLLLSQVGTAHTAHQTPYLNRALMQSVYQRAGTPSAEGKPIRGKRLFLFDYDGTLTPIVKTPDLAVPSPAALEALSLLSADPSNVVYIISGRDGGFLEQHLGGIKGMGMSAEHGGFMKLPNYSGEKAEWVNLTEKLDMEWMSEVEEVFRYYTERTTGSHIEIKKSSITWHYRSSDPEWGLFQCRQCQDLLENNLAHKRPIEVLVGKKNLEVRPLAVNKGEIVKRILYENPQAEYVFCAGDDKTDEDMFRALVPFAAHPTSTPATPSATGGSDAKATKVIMEAPLGSYSADGSTKPPPVELALRPEGVFSTAVGSSSKKTLARWHVTSPQEVIESMLTLVHGESKL